MSAVHHHCYIVSEGGWLAAFGKEQRGPYSLYSRRVLLIGQQRQLRTSVSLQLRVFEHTLPDSGLRESAGDPTINPIEASAKHGVGYLPR